MPDDTPDEKPEASSRTDEGAARSPTGAFAPTRPDRVGGHRRRRGAGVARSMRTFVFQTFYIPSGSMEPTLHDRRPHHRLQAQRRVGHHPPRRHPRLQGSTERALLASPSPTSSSGSSACPATASDVKGQHHLCQRQAVDETWSTSSPSARPSARCRRAGEPLLHDGRQPPGLLRQPFLGLHPAFGHHRQGLPQNLAAWTDSASSRTWVGAPTMGPCSV